MSTEFDWVASPRFKQGSEQLKLHRTGAAASAATQPEPKSTKEKHRPRIVGLGLPIGAALMTVLLWAGSFLAIRDGVQAVSPFGLAAARFALAGLICVVWIAFFARKKPRKGHLPRILLCGLLGIALYNILLGAGEIEISAGLASLCVATQTLFAGIAAWSLEGTRPTRQFVFGGILAMLGIVVIATRMSLDGTLTGVALTVGAAACTGTFFVLQRPLVKSLGPVTSAACTMLAGGVLLLPWLPGGIAASLSDDTVFRAVIFLALFASIGGYVFWMVAIDGLGAAPASLFLFLISPIALALDWILDRETISIPTAVGVLVVLAGVGIAARPTKQLKRA
jgi:drug/metabolite transporter (DMT)-like permease